MGRCKPRPYFWKAEVEEVDGGGTGGGFLCFHRSRAYRYRVLYPDPCIKPFFDALELERSFSTYVVFTTLFLLSRRP